MKKSFITSGPGHDEVDHFYQQLQKTIGPTPKKDIMVVQGELGDEQLDWGAVCGPYCNVETNERDRRLLKFVTFNNLVLTNHPEDGLGTAQMRKITTRSIRSW